MLGGWSRFALRRLCALSVKTAQEQGKLARALPTLQARFGEEPGCAHLLEELARRLE